MGERESENEGEKEREREKGMSKRARDKVKELTDTYVHRLLMRGTVCEKNLALPKQRSSLSCARLFPFFDTDTPLI